MTVTKNEYVILKAVRENNSHVLRIDLVSNFPDIISTGTYRYLLDNNLLCEYTQEINNRMHPVCDLTSEGSHSILEYEETQLRFDKTDKLSEDANRISRASVIVAVLAAFISGVSLYISLTH